MKYAIMILIAGVIYASVSISCFSVSELQLVVSAHNHSIDNHSIENIK